MNALTLDDVVAATCGRLVLPQGLSKHNLTCAGISTDSRKLMPQALFVALRGERFDGHAFVAAADRTQMAAAVVDEAGHAALAAVPVPQIVVRDTTHALGELARWQRRRIDKPVAAITGSNGKTTAKEMLAQALGQRGPVHKTPGNLNNLVGLPLTVFAWPDAAWLAVLEMGMNAPGEIARLTAIAEPQVGLITCVAAAHLQGLGTLQRVAQAKVELFAHLPEGAAAVINADDGPLCAAAAPFIVHRPVYRFGTTEGCDVRLVGAEHVRDGQALALRVTLQFGGTSHAAVLPLVGVHNGMNAAGAVAAAMALGVDGGEALQRLTEVQVPGARGRVVHSPQQDLWILDDCYNANPQSMAAALLTLRQLAQGAPTVAILGDMRELGEGAPAHHHELGRVARSLGVDHTIAFGELAHHVALGAGASAQAFALDTAPAAVAEAARRHLPPHAWCLVKGSRGMRLERVVQELLGPAALP